MQAIVFSTYRTLELASGNAKHVLAAVAERADSANIAAEISLATETAFAFECSGTTVGDVSISFEIKRGTPFFTVTESVLASPVKVVELGDVPSLKAAKDALKPLLTMLHPEAEVSVEEASKYTRITMDGELRHGSKLNPLTEDFVSRSIPVVALIRQTFGNYYAALV